MFATFKFPELFYSAMQIRAIFISISVQLEGSKPNFGPWRILPSSVERVRTRTGRTRVNDGRLNLSRGACVLRLRRHFALRHTGLLACARASTLAEEVARSQQYLDRFTPSV